MNQRQVKRTRTVGKILFVLYIFFLLYFLIFSDWYGRSGIGEEYRCNLVLFKEIRRFVEYRETLGLFAVFIWKYPDFCAIWIFYIRCQQDERLFDDIVL